MFAILDGTPAFFTMSAFPEVKEGKPTGKTLLVIVFFDGVVEQHVVDTEILWSIEELIKYAAEQG